MNKERIKIEVLLTHEQKDLIRAASQASGLSMSAWMRSTALRVASTAGLTQEQAEFLEAMRSDKNV